MKIERRNGVTVMDLGAIEIWDGADLALLRDTLARLIEAEGCRSIGVNMSYVKYIPSGFFGMLFDWHERGVAMRLYSPQKNVANMLWFRRFFEHECDGCHVLRSEPLEELPAPLQPGWIGGRDWEDESDESVARSIAAAGRS